LPHIPQCWRRVFVSTSQPFPALMSQFPQPVLHEAIVHIPLVQAPIAFGGAHDAPHEPQFVSVSSAVSQPFASIPSQLPNPAWHTSEQFPIEHVPLATFGPVVGQVTPHPPQFINPFRSVSHPFAALMSQSSQPALHEAMRHIPVVHVPMAFVGVHAVPHAPQFDTVVSIASQPSVIMALQLP
jgi:hypothetical protein